MNNMIEEIMANQMKLYIFSKFTRINFWLLLLVLTSLFDAIFELKLMKSKVIWNRTYREGKSNFNL